MEKSDHSIEIDITLGVDGVDRDFDELERKAKEGTKSVVKVVEQLTSTMKETGTGAKEAGQDFKESAEKMEKSAKEAEEGTADLSDSMGELAEKTQETSEEQKEFTDQTKDASKSQEELEDKLKKTGEEQEELEDKTEKTRQTVEKSKGTFLSWGDIAKTAVAGVVVVSGALFTALGAGAGVATKFGIEYKKAANDIQAETGATAEEMKDLSDVMKNVYTNNFGEDMGDVADGVANIKKYLGGTKEEIQAATESAFAFRDTFGYEIPESARAASAIIKNFGGDAEHAYDLMAKGAQNGLDFSGELLDNIDEYSVQFAKAGLTAEQMFNIMAAGYDAGAWNLDKIGDAVKELNVRLVDGSDTTKEGLKAIGMNADEVAKKMSQGGDVAADTYKKVVENLAKMDDKQAQNIAGVNLFGTMWEDLGPEVVSQLATMEGAYDDVAGTMEKINEVKYDDAGSAMEALKRKAETSLLLPISENIMPAISGATEAAIGYIDQLADAYETEGVNGLVEKAGDIFADITVKAAEEAPHMVDTAIGFVEQFVGGLTDNGDKLLDAGAQLTRSVCRAAVKILPKELREPVVDAVDDVIDSITGGGIKNSVKTFGRMFENGFKVVGTVTKTVLPPFVKLVDKAGDNMDTLVPVLAAGLVIFKGYKNVSTVTTTVKGFAAVTDVLTGKVKIATVAQGAWNAVCSAFGGPVGLVITGLVAAGAAVAAYCLSADEGADGTVRLTKAEEQLIDKINGEHEAYQELLDERKKQFDGINAEFGYTQQLADELKGIVDENGKIKEGYKERAEVITGLLNDALGTEISITDDVIENYAELKDSIDQVIATKKAEAIQAAMQDDYVNAVKEQTNAYMKYTQAQKDVENTTNKLIEAKKKQKEIMDKVDVLSSNEDYESLRRANNEVESLEANLKEQSTALNNASNDYAHYMSTIKNYEGIDTAKATGEIDKLNKAVALCTEEFVYAEYGTKESLKRQVDNMQDHYHALKEAMESGAPNVTQEMVDEAALMVSLAQNEYTKSLQFYYENGKDVGEKHSNGIEETTGLVVDAAEAVSDEGNKALGSADTESTGEGQIDKYDAGIESKSGEAKAASKKVSDAAVSGLDTGDKSCKEGQNFAQGYVKGIQSMVSAVAGASIRMAAESIKSVKSTIRSNSPAKATIELGENFGQGYTNGIAHLAGDAAKAAGEMGLESVRALKSKMQTASLGIDVDATMQRAHAVVMSRATSYAEPRNTSTVYDGNQDDFKKKADYLISGFRKAVKDQGDTVIEWKGRELARMYREVLE